MALRTFTEPTNQSYLLGKPLLPFYFINLLFLFVLTSEEQSRTHTYIIRESKQEDKLDTATIKT